MFEMQLGKCEMQLGEFEMQLGKFEMQVGKFPQYLEFLHRATAAARLFRSFSNIQSQSQIFGIFAASSSTIVP